MSEIKYEGTSMLTDEGEPLFGRQRNIRAPQQKISTTHLLLFILIFIGRGKIEVTKYSFVSNS